MPDPAPIACEVMSEQICDAVDLFDCNGAAISPGELAAIISTRTALSALIELCEGVLTYPFSSENPDEAWYKLVGRAEEGQKKAYRQSP